MGIEMSVNGITFNSKVTEFQLHLTGEKYPWGKSIALTNKELKLLIKKLKDKELYKEDKYLRKELIKFLKDFKKDKSINFTFD